MKKLRFIFCVFTLLIVIKINAQQKKTTSKTPPTKKTETPTKSNSTSKPAENPSTPVKSNQEQAKRAQTKSTTLRSKSASSVGKGGNCFRMGNNVTDLTVGISGWGIPIAVQGEHFFTDDISGGVILSYSRYTGGFSSDYAWNFIYGGPRVNYHFNRLIKNFPDNMDFYGGASMGYWHGWFSGGNALGFNYGGTVYISLNAGGRYYFSDKFGVMAELGGGNISSIRAGVSLKF